MKKLVMFASLFLGLVLLTDSPIPSASAEPMEKKAPAGALNDTEVKAVRGLRVFTFRPVVCVKPQAECDYLGPEQIGQIKEYEIEIPKMGAKDVVLSASYDAADNINGIASFHNITVDRLDDRHIQIRVGGLENKLTRMRIKITVLIATQL
jgi:hypothetical protein